MRGNATGRVLALIALFAALVLPGNAAALGSTRYVSLSGTDAPP